MAIASPGGPIIGPTMPRFTFPLATPTGPLVLWGVDAELPAMPAAAPTSAQVVPTAAVRMTVDPFIGLSFLVGTLRVRGSLIGLSTGRHEDSRHAVTRWLQTIVPLSTAAARGECGRVTRPEGRRSDTPSGMGSESPPAAPDAPPQTRRTTEAAALTQRSQSSCQ